MSTRQKLIISILSDLENLRQSKTISNEYAIVENITFFRAIVSFPKYLHWLCTRAFRLDASRILELSDLSIPRWDREMHERLAAIERKPFPGLITPLVQSISKYILENEKDLIFVSLGCGAMEVERQVIDKIPKNRKQKIVFVGIDTSPVVHIVARKNLASLDNILEIKEVEYLDNPMLQRLIRTSEKKYLIIFCKNNIFNLEKQFDQQCFDIAYHSLLRHHLDTNQQAILDNSLRIVARQFWEYDGYRSLLLLLPQTLTTWRYPVLLNATIFSNLRYRNKKDIQHSRTAGKLSFFKMGTYLFKKP